MIDRHAAAGNQLPVKQSLNTPIAMRLKMLRDVFSDSNDPCFIEEFLLVITINA